MNPDQHQKDRHELDNGRLRAVIKAEGAELCSLRGTDGDELLWQAGPVWPRHAPVLFPIVGRLKDDALVHGGASHRMTQHGFARDRRFAWIDQQPESCRLVLEDDGETRRLYPFAFRLEIAFALEDDSLVVRHAVSNPGTDDLPASLGVHPAFRWPLADGIPKEDHEVEFEEDEPAPIRRIDKGLLLPESFPTPVEGRRLRLDDSLFEADALILDQPRSRSVRYSASAAPAGTPTITVSWEGFEQLGLWSKPGGDFLCVEPWYGYSSPAGFDGEFSSKPCIMRVPPGGRREFSYRVTLGRSA
jgi:galactose mutarotase-like enzyme